MCISTTYDKTFTEIMLASRYENLEFWTKHP